MRGGGEAAVAPAVSVCRLMSFRMVAPAGDGKKATVSARQDAAGAA